MLECAVNTDHGGVADTHLGCDNLDFLEFEQDFSCLRNLKKGEKKITFHYVFESS